MESRRLETIFSLMPKNSAKLNMGLILKRSIILANRVFAVSYDAVDNKQLFRTFSRGRLSVLRPFTSGRLLPRPQYEKTSFSPSPSSLPRSEPRRNAVLSQPRKRGKGGGNFVFIFLFFRLRPSGFSLLPLFGFLYGPLPPKAHRPSTCSLQTGFCCGCHGSVWPMKLCHFFHSGAIEGGTIPVYPQLNFVKNAFQLWC